jgi:hypothetical protein
MVKNGETQAHFCINITRAVIDTARGGDSKVLRRAANIERFAE